MLASMAFGLGMTFLAGAGSGAVPDSSLASLYVLVRDIRRQPIPGANVRVAATRIGSITDEAGAARLRGIPPGSRPVIVRLIGYQPRDIDVQFVAGEQETLLVQMVPTEPRDELDLPASQIDPYFGLRVSFTPHLGLVLIEPDGPLLAASRDSIANGTPITAIFLDGSARPRSLRVLRRIAQQESDSFPPFQVPGRPRYFRLEWVRPAEAVGGRGLAVIDAKSKPRGGAWRARMDINGDGRREEIWACDEDKFLRINVREPRSKVIVWSSLSKPGTRGPPVCKPTSYW